MPNQHSDTGISFFIADTDRMFTVKEAREYIKEKACRCVAESTILYRWEQCGRPSVMTMQQLTHGKSQRGGNNEVLIDVIEEDGSVVVMSLATLGRIVNERFDLTRPDSSYRGKWERAGAKKRIRITNFYPDQFGKSHQYPTPDLSHIPAGDLAHLSGRRNTGAARAEAEHWNEMNRGFTARRQNYDRCTSL